MSEITLYEGSEQITLTHAIPSGKARVEVAKVVGQDEALDPKAKMIAERVMMFGEERSQEAISAMLTDKSITIDDVLAMNKVDAKTIEANNAKLYKLFRIAADLRQLSTEWKTRINSDAWMDEQNVKEVEQFVASFRKSLGV